jgi:hypothetical protein
MSLGFTILSAETVPNTYSWDYGVPFSSNSPLITATAIINSTKTNALGRAPGIKVGFEINPFFASDVYIWNFGDAYNENSNIIISQNKQLQEHVYLMPGTYNISLSSATRNLSFTRLSAVTVTEILPKASLFSATRPVSGNTPYTITFSPKNVLPGSFPIDRIDWDFGDGSPIQVVTRFSILDSDKFTFTNVFSSDIKDPRNYNPNHTYIRTYDTGGIYYPSLTAYSSSTGSYDACSIGIGPIFIDQILNPDNLQLLKVRNNNQQKIYWANIADDLAIVTTNNKIKPPTISTFIPKNKLKDSYNTPSIKFTGNPGSIAYPPVGILTDPFFPNVSLLLHGEGVEGSSNIIDSSEFANTFFNNGALPIISTSQRKIQASSIFFEGNRYLQILPSSESDLLEHFNFYSSDDFTIEGWFFISELTYLTPFLYKNQAWFFYINNDATPNTIAFRHPIFSYGFEREYNFTTNNWFHLAITRKNGIGKMFVNGIQVGSSEVIDFNFVSPYDLRIGLSIINSNFKGYMDEIRITKGFSRYNNNFTPSVDPFPDARVPFY